MPIHRKLYAEIEDIQAELEELSASFSFLTRLSSARRDEAARDCSNKAYTLSKRMSRLERVLKKYYG